MSTSFVPDLYLAPSQDRLEACRPPAGTDLEMLTNYFWNIDLIEALVPCMHAVELALRNSLHNALTAQNGTGMWFYEPGVLESQEVIGLGRALQDAARKSPLKAGKIVAALSFGFWVSLLGSKYEQRLWQPKGYALQKIVFPHAAGKIPKGHPTALRPYSAAPQPLFSPRGHLAPPNTSARAFRYSRGDRLDQSDVADGHPLR